MREMPAKRVVTAFERLTAQCLMVRKRNTSSTIDLLSERISGGRVLSLSSGRAPQSIGGSRGVSSAKPTGHPFLFGQDIRTQVGGKSGVPAQELLPSCHKYNL